MSPDKDKSIDKQIADRNDVIDEEGGSEEHRESLKREIKNLEYEKESRTKKQD